MELLHSVHQRPRHAELMDESAVLTALGSCLAVFLAPARRCSLGTALECSDRTERTESAAVQAGTVVYTDRVGPVETGTAQADVVGSLDHYIHIETSESPGVVGTAELMAGQVHFDALQYCSVSMVLGSAFAHLFALFSATADSRASHRATHSIPAVKGAAA